MFNPSPATTIVIPFKAGPEAELGPVVNDAYFGKVPADRLVVKRRGVLFFSGDGKYRSKIGISPAAGQALRRQLRRRERGPDARPADRARRAPTDYVNSMWEIQEKPFAGDVVNSYNDGPASPGRQAARSVLRARDLSPAAALGPGETLTHVHTTMHFAGAEEGPRRDRPQGARRRPRRDREGLQIDQGDTIPIHLSPRQLCSRTVAHRLGRSPRPSDIPSMICIFIVDTVLQTMNRPRPKWGNSLAVRIPKSFADDLGIEDDSSQHVDRGWRTRHQAMGKCLGPVRSGRVTDENSTPLETVGEMSDRSEGPVSPMEAGLFRDPSAATLFGSRRYPVRRPGQIGLTCRRSSSSPRSLQCARRPGRPLPYHDEASRDIRWQVLDPRPAVPVEARHPADQADEPRFARPSRRAICSLPPRRRRSLGKLRFGCSPTWPSVTGHP